MHWELAGSVCPQGPAGVLAASRGIEGLIGVSGGHGDPSGSVGVHWGLTGSVCAQGPAGV